ncbi:MULTISPECIES: sirohydrochlorin chelatase [unclassified Streptomyces]|uniref:sirohydrochlorin chelatase n=1 Tax=unclassified Streptomyces TaxID=2593676 RepID=UPI00081EB553|nr:MULTISPECIES: sirohydrochlorin chelatase [unclassified Streptomyces]MYR25188.1 sirohydrochlorin chelatase [Streptomyces sp. SID4945]SCE75931.1 Sirohydrochlorin ferrochelatase [Streptomyces sp. LcepLS]
MPASRPALLVVAHGSRDPRHAATVRELVARVERLRPGLAVETAFLDFVEPSVPEALARLAAAGAREVVALPLLLTRAFHAKSDIPAVLDAASRALPGRRLRVRLARVLGPSPLLTAALERRLAEAGVRRAERASTAVVLAAAGSSDPEAATVLEGLARQWRGAGWGAVRLAYASARGPRTEEAVRALRAAGWARIAVAPYVLAPGFLPDRIARGARESGADVLAEALGPAPEVARLLVRRYEDALLAPVPRLAAAA